MDHEHILTLETDPEGPEKLEAAYREGRTAFTEALPAALAERPRSVLLRAWVARLAPDAVSDVSRVLLWGMIALALTAGLFVKLPELLPFMSESEFYPRNISFGPLGALILYLLHSHQWPRKASVIIGLLLATVVFYLNLYPEIDSDVAVLVLTHAPLFLWCVAAMAHAGTPRPDAEAKRSWIRFFGELIIFSGLLLLGGAVLVSLTFGLFELLDAPLDWIWEWMMPMGAAAIPVVAAWAVSHRGGGASAGARIMPILARIFSPLFLVVLAMYLLRLAADVTELFESRETLLMYNVLLLSVLGLCVFSLSGQGAHRAASENRWLHWLLAILAALTVVFDVIGLAAIVNRIAEMGLTPNRLVVLGANVTVLGNFLLLLRSFVRILAGTTQPAELERVTARYLPAYAAWTLFVCIGFPLLF